MGPCNARVCRTVCRIITRDPPGCRICTRCPIPAPTQAHIGAELAQCLSTQSRPLIQRSPVRFRARSHTGVMDYDEACFMHLTPGVVHNFPKAVGV